MSHDIQPVLTQSAIVVKEVISAAPCAPNYFLLVLLFINILAPNRLFQGFYEVRSRRRSKTKIDQILICHEPFPNLPIYHTLEHQYCCFIPSQRNASGHLLSLLNLNCTHLNTSIQKSRVIGMAQGNT